MAWTYSGDPSLSDLDMVRFLAGDTDISEQLVTDEEIEAAIDRYGIIERAAARIARGIAAKFSRLADQTVGDVKISWSQKAANYNRTADELDAMARASAASSSRRIDQLTNTYVW